MSLAQLLHREAARSGSSAYGAGEPPLATEWMARALDEVDYPMAVVGVEGTLAWTNRSARALLRSGVPLRVDEQGRLHAADGEREEAFQQACTQASRRGLRKWVSLSASRFAAAIFPLQGRSDGPMQTLVVLSRPALCEQLTLQGFARLYELTPAETEVLSALAAGRKPSQIARDHQVAISTVRTQIGALRSKTGATSIPQLVASISRLPPMMSVLAAV